MNLSLSFWIFSIHKSSRQTPLHCQWPLVYSLWHAGECKGVCLFHLDPCYHAKCFYFFRFRQRMIITWLRRWTSKQPISGTRIRCIRVQNRPNCNWQIWRSFSGATSKSCCDSIDLFSGYCILVVESVVWGGGGYWFNNLSCLEVLVCHVSRFVTVRVG